MAKRAMHPGGGRALVTSDARLAALAERYWQEALAADPVGATILGYHDHDDTLPDLSRPAEDARIAQLDEVVRAADALDPASLDPQDRVTRAILRFNARTEADELRSRLAEIAVSPAFVGPHVVLLQLPGVVTLDEPSHAEALVTRYRNVHSYLKAAGDRLREGVAHGRTPPSVAVVQVVEQLDTYLATPVGDDPFVGVDAPPQWDEEQSQRWRQQLEDAVVDVVRPALAAYRDTLAREIAPHARPPERSGVVWLPDGEELYARAIERGTTVALPADEIHDLGRTAIAALGEEYRELGQRVLGTSDLEEIFTRLRDDRALRFSTREEVLAGAERALRRAQDAVPAWFGRLPRVGCDVRPMPEFEVKEGTIAYYMPPAIDGTRPGIYYVNTYAPGTRTRFESEALAFHESVPGHHLQIGLTQELDLPEFRRHSSINAYVEGWALYVERLADEMGLYSGDLERFGMLSFDSWRAGRLVVDTGVHHLGWGRQRAIDFLREHTPQAENNIANEVDRYINWPGQALGYKLGQREMRRLREYAEGELGDAFDIRAFHDTVLGHGAVPLVVLSEIVEEWVQSAP